MAKMIFVNLPVTDLQRSMAFYEAVGFTNNPQFTNDQAAAMVWSDTIHVMLLTHDFWKTFTDRAIPNAHESAQVFLCLSHDSRQEVDAIEIANAKVAIVDLEPADGSVAHAEPDLPAVRQLRSKFASGQEHFQKGLKEAAVSDDGGVIIGIAMAI